MSPAIAFIYFKQKKDQPQGIYVSTWSHLQIQSILEASVIFKVTPDFTHLHNAEVYTAVLLLFFL